MTDHIEILLQLDRQWHIFINGGLVTRRNNSRVPRQFETHEQAVTFLEETQTAHLERTGQDLSWTIPEETQ